MELVNSFTHFFHEKVEKIRLDLDKTTDVSPPPLTVTQQPQYVLEQFLEVSSGEMRRVIMKSPTKQCALDVLPTWILKDDDVLEAVLPTLTAIANKSLNRCCAIFP